VPSWKNEGVNIRSVTILQLQSAGFMLRGFGAKQAIYQGMELTAQIKKKISYLCIS
jgi:hypothetical protein